ARPSISTPTVHPSRRKAIVIAFILAALVIVGGAGWYFGQKRKGLPGNPVAIPTETSTPVPMTPAAVTPVLALAPTPVPTLTPQSPPPSTPFPTLMTPPPPWITHGSGP